MDVGKSIKKAIDECDQRDFESAMLHACNAIDGTAKKVSPPGMGVGQRFKKLLRDNYGILGPMGMPGIDIERTRFPVTLKGVTNPEEGPDLADIVYVVHRCTHGHGDELPEGFELVADDASTPGRTWTVWSPEKVRLSHRIIWGLLGVAVMHPANRGLSVPPGYHFTFGATARLEINEWWGRAEDFPSIASLEPMPSVTMDFSTWGYGKKKEADAEG
jgi:hypothetical protein